MKVKIKHINGGPKESLKNIIDPFIKLLQKEYPLSRDLSINFTGERVGGMSTGSRTEKSEIFVLTNSRMNRDILRTLAHEWVHEYQRGVLNREKGPDIGGENEDEANAEAGRIIKVFEKEYPEKENVMYEGLTKLESKLRLLNEQILKKEKENIHENFLLEMKKIGIEKLPYSYSSIKRFVDPETMNVHYNKHYKGYVKKLNDALSKKNYGDLELEDIIKTIGQFDDTIRNNAGGAFNHALFWKMLSPKKQKPQKETLELINKQFSNIKKMKDEFNEVAKERFGSGWVWLVLNKQNKLTIMSTPNQDNPLMNIVKNGGYPILGLDLWEHAYYLRYRNKRDQYVKKFWDSVNWEFVNELLLLRLKK